jgi:hypothetical protein
MNKQEHKLIIGMLATQLALTTELIATLKDKGALGEAEFQKIWKAAISTGPEKMHFYDQVSGLYKAMAKAVGVNVEIDDAPGAAR